MFKQLTAAILLIAFVAQTFFAVVVLADYYANTAAYAKICVNKAKPAMHCNGKCQMMKKLKQQEKRDEQNPGRKYENKSGVLYFSAKQYADRLFIASISLKYAPYNNSRSSEIAFDFFQPPRA